MYTKDRSRFLYKLSAILLWVSLILSPFVSRGVFPARAQPNTPDMRGYEFGDLPLDAHNALMKAVQTRPSGVLDGGTYFVVGQYETNGTWGIGHLGAAIGSEPPEWDRSVWFIVHATDPIQVALQSTSRFDNYMAYLPISLKSQIQPSMEKLNTPAEKFLFPWDKSQQWRYTYGWHGGTNLAIDFAPSNVTPNNAWILASESGTITLVCGDSYQAAVDLSTASGITTYRHIDYNSYLSQNINNQAISQGHKVSLLYNGNQGEGYYDTSQAYPWPACTQGSSSSCVHIQFNTYCGAGTGAHVHWTLPTKPFTVEGWQIDLTGTWTQSGQPNRTIGALFSSTNQSDPRISGNTGAAGATLNYTNGTPKTVKADGAGNYSITVPSGWSGTITPSHPCFIFTPDSQVYNNVTGNLIDQNYTVTSSGICVSSAFSSSGLYDGWILESTETSSQGGTMNSNATLLYTGDNVQDKQYRSILSFNTSGLPDNAIVTKVRVKINIQGFAGGNMFTPTKTLGNLLMDIRKPRFGTSADLMVDDFQAAANKNSVGVLSSVTSTGWRIVTLKSTAYDYINLTGTTQFRLRFQNNDNDDLGNDYIKIFSGDASAANRPQLIVEYYVP